jgi:hypothetical protein
MTVFVSLLGQMLLVLAVVMWIMGKTPAMPFVALALALTGVIMNGLSAICMAIDRQTEKHNAASTDEEFPGVITPLVYFGGLVLTAVGAVLVMRL